MALITTVGRALGMPSIVEDNDHIYITGQAYTKDTLTPVFGKNRHHNTVGTATAANARLARWCTIPDYSSNNLNCYADSTLGDPGGLLTNHSTLTVGTDVFFFPSTFETAWTSNVSGVYTKMDSSGVYQGGYSFASLQHAIIPLGYNASLNQIWGITPSGNGSTTSQSVLVTMALTPGAFTAQLSMAYGFSCSLLSENATYYFIGTIVGSSTVACNLRIDAVNKATAAQTAILASTAQSTTYPRLTVSNPYSQSTDSKWVYTAGANAADPFYTIRYNNYNQSSLTNTGGDCTINWNGSSSAAELPSPTKSTGSSIRTWVVTGTSNSFVYFAICDDGSYANQTVANMKMHGFQIGGTPSSLTFKETIAIGTAHGRIRNIFPVTNNWRTIAVMTDSDATLYTWDDTNGYTQGVSISYAIKNTNPALAGTFGVDTSGRIWIHSSGGTGSTLSVYSPTVATTITLTFAASSYNYSGTTISSSFNLSAYNSSGSRIATDVQVVFDSPNCTFSDDTTTKTITTSSSAETTTNIKITAPGQVRAVANIAV